MLFSIPSLLRRKRFNGSPLVKKSFILKFPNAKRVLWYQIDIFKWRVNFTLKEKKHSALFDSEGNWMETITLIPLNKIPKALQLTFEEIYSKDDLQKIYYVQTPDRSIYEMNLNNGLYSFKLLFDVSGNIIGTLIS